MRKTIMSLLTAAAMTTAGGAMAGENVSGAPQQVGPLAVPVLFSYAAVVDSAGTLIRGHSGTKVVKVAGTSGSYRVHFSTNVKNCAFVGTPGTTGSLGVVSAAIVTVAGDALDKNGVYVKIYDLTGNGFDSSFHLLVTC